MFLQFKYNNLWINFGKWSTIKLWCMWEILCPCWKTICNASFTYHLSTFILSWEKECKWLSRVTVFPVCTGCLVTSWDGTWGPLQKSLSIMAVCGSWLKTHYLVDMIFQNGRNKKLVKVFEQKQEKSLTQSLGVGLVLFSKIPIMGESAQFSFKN